MKRYSAAARGFHWLIAAMIVSQYVLAELAEYAKIQGQTLEQLALLANHKSVGISILLLALARLAYRLIVKPPPLPKSMPAWQHKASHISHALLYLFLFALPLTGWLMSSAKAYSVSWFNLLALPDLVSANDILAESLKTVHLFLAKALFVVASLHILAALKHHFFDKDDVLNRMAGAVSWVIFVAAIVAMIGFLGRLINESEVESSLGQKTISASQQLNAMEKSNLPRWDIDYKQSYIRFTGEQAGAPFTGEWASWKAELQFDSARLSQSRFDVRIDTSSGFSNDQERDETIRSTEFFDVKQYAQARYTSNEFSMDGQQFLSNGRLSMKGISDSATLRFEIEQSDGQIILTGSAPIDRLLWNIGTGDWTDTSWVGQQVMVEVKVVTKK